MNPEDKEREGISLSEAMDQEGFSEDVPEEWTQLRSHLQNTDDIQAPDADWMFGRIQQEIKKETSSRNVFQTPWLKLAAGVVLLIGLAGVLFRSGFEGSDSFEGGGVLWVETHLPDSSSIVYEDVETGVTVVWMISEEDV